jgi:hypothetical protein
VFERTWPITFAAWVGIIGSAGWLFSRRAHPRQVGPASAREKFS